MKTLMQFALILLITVIGEFLHALLPLPVPAGIYGLVLLFFCLCFKIIPLSCVKDASNALLSIMPVLFIPSSVGIMASWSTMSNHLLAYFTIAIVTTVLVMGVSGSVTQWIIRKGGKRN